MINYAIKEELAVLSQRGDNKKMLAVVAWNNAAPKIDIRTWFAADGECLPSKGITLTIEEAEVLCDALADYLRRAAPCASVE